MAWFAYIQIFVGFFCSLVLTFFPFLLTYKQFVILVAIASVVMCFWALFALRGRISVRFLVMVGILLLLIGLYTSTRYLYVFSNDMYQIYLLVLVGQVAPSMLYASLVALNPQVQTHMKQYAPMMAIIFTVLSFMATFFPNMSDSHGLIANANGLSYQSTSYLAAYATAFWGYCMITAKAEFYHFKFMKKSISSLLFVSGMMLNLVTILLAGGRGGLVAFCVFFLLSIILTFKQQKITLPQLLVRLIGLLVLAFIIYGLVFFAQNFASPTSGVRRILAALQEGDSSGRDVLYMQAWQIIKSNFFFGHGIGSVFYELGFYSHNIFLDLLIETGLFGCLIILGGLVKILHKAYQLYVRDYTNILWIYLFLCGFLMTLFSGYYLATVPIWWSIAFIYCCSLPPNTSN